MSSEPTFVYARLNARVMPIDRGDRYEDPLDEALKKVGAGEVTGGGTMQSQNGEIDYCGIDIDVINVEEGIPLICKVLTKLGAPKGSKLEFEQAGEQREMPFGDAEGLGIYFNGTDLPEEVYNTCDINHVFDEINRLLGDRGEIQGYWQGPTETALYLYGHSVEEMKDKIAPLMANYPLCQRARYETIA